MSTLEQAVPAEAQAARERPEGITKLRGIPTRSIKTVGGVTALIASGVITVLVAGSSSSTRGEGEHEDRNAPVAAPAPNANDTPKPLKEGEIASHNASPETTQKEENASPAIPEEKEKIDANASLAHAKQLLDGAERLNKNDFDAFLVYIRLVPKLLEEAKSLSKPEIEDDIRESLEKERTLWKKQAEEQWAEAQQSTALSVFQTHVENARTAIIHIGETPESIGMTRKKLRDGYLRCAISAAESARMGVTIGDEHNGENNQMSEAIKAALDAAEGVTEGNRDQTRKLWEEWVKQQVKNQQLLPQ